MKKSVKVTVSAEYLHILASSELTSNAFRCLMLLIEKPLTAAQIAEELKMQRQNTSRYISELTEKGLVEVDRVEGRNKFIKAVTSPSKIKTFSDITPGQMKMIE